nr:G-type lectin S-receptor-like serine/threonine-protein kinase At1g67520 [Ipomoea trifida]
MTGMGRIIMYDSLVVTIVCCLFIWHGLLLSGVSAKNTLAPGETLLPFDDEYLESSNKLFKLKFMKLSGSGSAFIRGFLSIQWAVNVVTSSSEGRTIWVAWLGKSETYGVPGLIMEREGRLLLFGESGLVINDDQQHPYVRNTTATLLDTGNLVLQGGGRTLWQSFDHPPGNTWIPGMKLGWFGLQKTPQLQKRCLTSWTSEENPSPGAFSLCVDPNNTKQLVAMRRGIVYWRSGVWNGNDFPFLQFHFSHLRYFSNHNESYFAWDGNFDAGCKFSSSTKYQYALHGETLYIRYGKTTAPIVQSTQQLAGHDEDLPFFDFKCIEMATNYFSEENKLGQGGFGPVYKAWGLWIEGKVSDLIDSTMDKMISIIEATRYIQVGLLCVQDSATDRPTMTDVVSMLGNESTILPIPKQPGFSAIIGLKCDDVANNAKSYSINEAASSEGEEEAPTTADYAGRRGATATGTITAASYARLNRALSSSLPPCSSPTAGSSLRRATIEDDGHCCYVARKRKTPSLGMRKEKSCPPLPVALYRRNHTHAVRCSLLFNAASSEGEEEAPTTADYAGRRGATATGTITAASYARLNRALSSSLPPCSSPTAGSSLRRATIEDDGHCCYVARKRKTPSLGMRKEKSCPPLPVALYRRNHTHAVRCSLLFNVNPGSSSPATAA